MVLGYSGEIATLVIRDGAQGRSGKLFGEDLHGGSLLCSGRWVLPDEEPREVDCGGEGL